MGEVVLGRLQDCRELVSGLDAESLGAAVAVEGAVAELARLERACSAARVRLAASLAAQGQRRSEHDVASFLAQVSGTSVAQARAELATTAGLDGRASTAAATASGELSLAQAREIVTATDAAPDAEAELLEVARRSGLASLRDAARRRRVEAIAPEELHRRQLASQTFHHWRDELGLVAFRGALPPEVGVPFVTRLDAETDRVRREARGRGDPATTRDVHAAQAFGRMIATGGDRRRRGVAAELVIVCDLRAWRRGHAHGGERCHIIGGGPVPVPLAAGLAEAEDAFVKGVLHDGVDIATVAHLGRYKKAELRTALALGRPPEFDGVACSEEGCDRRDGLEWDHVVPVNARGVTSFANLQPKCKPHHWEKTERDRAAGLLGSWTRPP